MRIQSNPLNGKKPLLLRIIKEYRNRGLIYVVRTGTIVLYQLFKFNFFVKRYNLLTTFNFQGKKYHYFYHWYNNAWRNERAVEIPIIWSFVNKYNGKNILEIGNVLSYYFTIHHDVVDKYDLAENIIKKDVINFSPHKKYDLIVSISTIEHIGRDEESKDPQKVLKILEKLKTFLSHKGIIVITFPLGYNEILDISIRKGKLKFNKLFFLQRKLSDINFWVESARQIKSNKKSDLWIPKNGLAIGIIENGE